MPVRRLSSELVVEQLSEQAAELRRDLAARKPDAAQRLREFHPRMRELTDEAIFSASLDPDDAELAIAHEYGFPSWARLVQHIDAPTLVDRLDLSHHERIEDPLFREAVKRIDTGDAAGLWALLQIYPRLIHQRVEFVGGNYFHAASLLEFIAENPVRHGRPAPEIVEVARVLLEAGPDQAARDHALMLVATGSVPRECGVQESLIALLCASGANPREAARLAAVLDEHGSVLELLRLGAKVDLPIAAALGLEQEFARLLAEASATDRHLALAVAAQFGHVELVRALLDAGVDPNRYNPPGGHSHATPLHQAAGAGHAEVVRLLVERGARLDLPDVLWHGTPADWAEHGGRPQIARSLRERSAGGGS